MVLYLKLGKTTKYLQLRDTITRHVQNINPNINFEVQIKRLFLID